MQKMREMRVSRSHSFLSFLHRRERPLLAGKSGNSVINSQQVFASVRVGNMNLYFVFFVPFSGLVMVISPGTRLLVIF